jgi:TRIAP1/MDM35 family protein
MESIGKECTKLKKKYEECFNKWYSEKFLLGQGKDETPCEELFEEYKACLMVTLKEKEIDKLIQQARTKQQSQDQSGKGSL